MPIAYVTPPAIQPCLERRFEGRFRQVGSVSVFFDGGYPRALIQRTEALPQVASSSQVVSTQSGIYEATTNLAVVIEPNAVAADSGGDRVSHKLSAIKRMTGWSWERLAEALGCSRQAVHGWTLGKDISNPNFERLAKLYATLVFIDRGDAEENRNLLQSVSKDGHIVSELLNRGQFEQVRDMLGAGNTRETEALRLRVANAARHADGTQHWFERMANTTGDEVPLEIVGSRLKKRIPVRPKR